MGPLGQESRDHRQPQPHRHDLAIAKLSRPGCGHQLE
jgi:hypothetical protein